MLYGLRQRLQFFKDAFARPIVTIVGGIIFLLTLAVTIRDGMLPPEYQQWRVLEILPHWPWYTWTIAVLTFLLIVVLEGSFRTHQERIRNSGVDTKTYRLRVRRELLPLLEEGQRLAKITSDEEPKRDTPELIEAEDRYWNERRAWMRETTNFLRIYLGEPYFDRFHSHNKHRGKISRSDIHEQVFQLEIIVRELME